MEDIASSVAYWSLYSSVMVEIRGSIPSAHTQ